MRTYLVALISFLVLPLTLHAAEITPKAAKELTDSKKALMLDVREESEAISEGMAQPAQLMPLSQISKNDAKWTQFLKDTPKDKTIILYCRSGGRAGRVENMLKEKGYTKVMNMGGFSDWKSAKLQVKKYTKN